jgi:hypothetical protein
MQKVRTVVMFLAATIATVAGAISSRAQPAPAANQPDSVSIHILMQKSSYVIGDKPIAVMTISNISSNPIWFSIVSWHYRVHITNKNSEPPKTEFYRHILGDVRPGDGPMLMSGGIGGWPIAPGSTGSQSYDLSAFYDLSTPGDYSVYLEIYDPSGPQDGSGHWLRTNPAQFKVQTSTQ